MQDQAEQRANDQKGAGFLHQKDSSLQQSHFVNLAIEQKKKTGERTPQKPSEKIDTWLDVLKKTHLSHRDDSDSMHRLKKYYHDKFCIKPENVPNSYFENQKRLYRERGQGNVNITEDMKKQNIEILINDQKDSFDKWFSYLTGPATDIYPMWVKYWIFDGVTRLAGYDKENHKFKKRDINTVNPFPDLNQEAVAKSIDLITKKVKGETNTLNGDPQLKSLLGNANFSEIYAMQLYNLENSGLKKEPLSVIEGQWVKYFQGSDHMPLVSSLEGYNTGWCTAGESTARSQLDGGDFYVYYSLDSEGNPKIPRIAIRMSGSSIAEVRGIAKDQNLDPYVNQIVEEKLQEFPDKEEYLKKVADMKKLTEIDHRVQTGENLTIENLRFLYEIDVPILGFGHNKDPRIREILVNRDTRKDLALVMGCTEEQVSTNQNLALKIGVKYHFGDLDFEGPMKKGTVLPETIKGSVFIDSPGSENNFVLPKKVSGSFGIYGISPTEAVTLPEEIEGNLLIDVGNLGGVKFPDKLGGSLTIYSVTAPDTELPEKIDGDLDFRELTDARGLKMSKSVSGSVYLDDLTTADGLTLPETIGGNLMLRGLTSTNGLTLSENIKGKVYFQSITPNEFDELKLRYPNLTLELEPDFYGYPGSTNDEFEDSNY